MNQLIYNKVTQLVNLALRLAPELRETLAAADEQSLAIIVTGTPIKLLLTLRNQELIINDYSESMPADCILQAPPVTLIHLLLTQNQQLLRQPAVSLQGDLLVMKTFSSLNQRLDLDWAKFFGNDLRDYLQDEIELLPPKLLVLDFLTQVTETWLASNRLEARIKRLEAAGKS